LTTVKKIHDFLSSIAPITHTDYQIRVVDGNLLYATNGDGNVAGFPMGTLKDITRRVIDGNTFMYNTTGAHMFLCGSPVLDGGEIRAALLAHGTQNNGCDPVRHREQYERHLCQTIAIIQENEGYQDEIQELAHQLELSFEDNYLYSQISDQVKSLTLSKQMLNDIMMKIVENMNVDAAFIALPQRPQFDMEIYRSGVTLAPDIWEKFIYDLQVLANPHLNSAADNYIIINDSRDNPSYEQFSALPYRFLMVGVRHQAELYGWIGLVSFNFEEIFRQGELRMLKSLAEQLAIVIANTDLYNNLEQFTETMVRSLVHAIEAKDPYTRGHSERVHHFTMLMAKQLRLKDDYYESLKWASILHDVGKIGISEQILLKPGKLSDEEFRLIKEHPEKGGRILQPVVQLANSLGGIVHHHERYDGKGYPHGLRGEEIPLAARIIAVADTFDAITSNRTYRKGRSHAKALEIIQSVAGTQLDPGIVKVFEKVYRQERV
jgi:hypothetical protein